jgi:hypothetical protein
MTESWDPLRCVVNKLRGPGPWKKRPQAQSRPVCAARQSTARHPFDGYTLGPVVAELEALTGIETRRIHVDPGRNGKPRHRLL